MINQKVKKFANKHGFDFYVSGLGYRGTAQITNFDGSVNISRCSNSSKDALQAINTLIAQRELDAKSDEAIADEAIEVIADLLPPVANDEVYLELLPIAPDRRRFYERPSYMGVGIEVYCGDERYGYALAELLDHRPANPVDVDYTLARQRMERMIDRDCERVMTFPVYTYDLMRY